MSESALGVAATVATGASAAAAALDGMLVATARGKVLVMQRRWWNDGGERAMGRVCVRGKKIALHEPRVKKDATFL